MNRTIWGTCVAVALTAVAGAQDKNMAIDKMDHKAMDKTYSGCVAISPTGSYTLTHLMIADAKKSAKKGASMMKADAMKKADSMKKEESMGHDAMAPTSLGLSAAGVDLSKHVGHKVTVTGSDGDAMNGMATFKVNTLKVIGASCS